MLDLCCDDVVARPVLAAKDPPEGCIVRFGPAGSENDFTRTRADEIGNPTACIFDCRPGYLAESVDGACVAKILLQEWQHRLQDPVVNPGRGTVVEVDLCPQVSPLRVQPGGIAINHLQC